MREYFSRSNIKSILRGFVYEYETPKIVTIHSVSSEIDPIWFNFNIRHWLCLLVALMCRLIQLLILVYGIAYLMFHKKGYQETDTSIISSITLKVKVKKFSDRKSIFQFDLMILFSRALATIKQDKIKRWWSTVQVDSIVLFILPIIRNFFSIEDYIVPPQENNALFLMTNFIRTDQKHNRCAGKFIEWFFFLQNLHLNKFLFRISRWKRIGVYRKFSLSNESKFSKGKREIDRLNWWTSISKIVSF